MTEGLKILIAIHGHELEDWIDEVRRALVPTSTALVRVLVVDEPPPAGFTSLLPAARRRYAAAVRMYREIAAAERRRRLDDLIPRLPTRPQVIHTVHDHRGAGRTIAMHASNWPAHVVVVGRDGRSPLSRWLLSSIHECVVREAPCTVVVVPASAASGAAALRRGVGRVATGLSR